MISSIFFTFAIKHILQLQACFVDYYMLCLESTVGCLETLEISNVLSAPRKDTNAPCGAAELPRGVYAYGRWS